MNTRWLVTGGALLALLIGIVGCVVVNKGGGTDAADPSEPAKPVKTVKSEPPDDGSEGGKGTGSAALQPVAGSGGACTSDADCVPAECCHAKTCTSKDKAPDCTDMMCTLDCRAGTMDCGWGKCVCQNGQCAADIKPPPKPNIKADPKVAPEPLPE
jgi:hypothetical protein